MKKQKHLIIALSLVIGVVVGLIVGFILTDPCRDVQDVAGTIGRVEHYRDVQIAEADIELRNRFLDDAGMLDSYRNYLTYEYTANIRKADNIRFALLAAQHHDEFYARNNQILERMKEYARLMDNARLRILEAIGVITDLENREGVAVRAVLNSAGNAIAQTQISGNVLFDYLLAVEDFFDARPRNEYPALIRAHDELYASLLMYNIIKDNKPVLDHLLAKNLMNEDGELAQMDNEQLRSTLIMDAARLQYQYLDQETLQDLLDQEVLQHIYIFDQETLRGSNLFDQETLESVGITDQELLKTGFTISDQEAINDLIIFDRETLQNIAFMDQQTLAGKYLLDQETLNDIMDMEVMNIEHGLFNQAFLDMVIMDTERLQLMLRSGEQLDDFVIGSSEQLQFILRDASMMNYDFRIMDSEQLDFF